MRLLEPVLVGSTPVPNRVVFGPHVTNLGRGRSFSERHAAYYRRRAEAGCGLIVLETASVHPSDWPYERAPLAPDCEPGWQAIAEALEGTGAVVVASLGHAGAEGSSAYSQSVLFGPSRFPDPVTREVPQQMEADDIDAIVESFAPAAEAARSSGLAGVEVHAGSASLLRQFLSGLTNTRTDDYGAERTLFVRRVLESARRGLGAGGVLGLRLGCDELAPWAGITPEGALAVVERLAPLVDYVVAVRAPVFDAQGSRPDAHTAPGFARPLAQSLRRALGPGVALVAQGSIVDATMAEDIVASGDADLVEMTRAQIADPDLVVKLSAGLPEQVRPCVLCNQRCQVRDARNPLVSCIGEPTSGHETEDPDLSRLAQAPLELLVVGAGPAGLEAARVASSRGHRVRVVERDHRTGGTLRTAAFGADQHRLSMLADWLARECDRLGVVIETGTDVGVPEIEAHLSTGGSVIVCTGSRPAPPRLTGASVLDAVSLLRLVEDDATAELPDGPVLVDDPVGDTAGIAIAERLGGLGRSVTLVTPDPVAGTLLSRTGDLAPANARLANQQVRIVRRAVVRALAHGTATVEDRFTGKTTEIGASVIIDAGGRLPDDGLAQLVARGLTAGDAVAPRSVYEAILEARRAVLAAEARRRGAVSR